MNTNILCQMGVNLAADNNAQANHFTAGFVGVNSLLAVTKAGANAENFSKLMIGPNFANLPPYATETLDKFNGQDQFETVVHELSHVILGTKDVKFDDGDTAYTADFARQLTGLSPQDGQINAENWGFFIEEFRT